MRTRRKEKCRREKQAKEICGSKYCRNSTAAAISADQSITTVRCVEVDTQQRVESHPNWRKGKSVITAEYPSSSQKEMRAFSEREELVWSYRLRRQELLINGRVLGQLIDKRWGFAPRLSVITILVIMLGLLGQKHEADHLDCFSDEKRIKKVTMPEEFIKVSFPIVWSSNHTRTWSLLWIRYGQTSTRKAIWCSILSNHAIWELFHRGWKAYEISSSGLSSQFMASSTATIVECIGWQFYVWFDVHILCSKMQLKFKRLVTQPVDGLSPMKVRCENWIEGSFVAWIGCWFDFGRIHLRINTYIRRWASTTNYGFVQSIELPTTRFGSAAALRSPNWHSGFDSSSIILDQVSYEFCLLHSNSAWYVTDRSSRTWDNWLLQLLVTPVWFWEIESLRFIFARLDEGLGLMLQLSQFWRDLEIHSRESKLKVDVPDAATINLWKEQLKQGPVDERGETDGHHYARL